MKDRFSLTLALCLSATAVACGDDTSTTPGPVDDASTPDASVSATPSTTPSTNPTLTSTAPSASLTPADGGAPDGGDTTDSGSTAGFEISSPNFDDGQPLPETYTCEGKAFGDGYSPELNWAGAPEGTLSYAVVFKDLSLLPDAPRYAYHWAAWNIPSTINGIPEHMSVGQFPEELDGGEQFRAGPPHDTEFFGPCPSWRNHCFAEPRVTDQYSFTLYAFAVDELPALPAVPAPEDMINYASLLDIYFQENAISWTEVNAVSDASPSSAPMCPPDAGADSGSDGAVDPVTDASTDAATSPTDASTDAAATDAATSDASGADASDAH